MEHGCSSGNRRCTHQLETLRSSDWFPHLRALPSFEVLRRDFHELKPVENKTKLIHLEERNFSKEICPRGRLFLGWFLFLAALGLYVKFCWCRLIGHMCLFRW